MDTFDIVEAVVSAKNDEIKDKFILNYDKLDILREYCEGIDGFIKEHDGCEISANIQDDTNYVSIEIEVMDFVYEKKFKSPIYLDLMERAVSIHFTNRGTDRLGVEFVFPSVWEAK